jgi:ABC-2 type transport system ATP-binding protein
MAADRPRAAPLVSADDLVVGHDDVAACAPVTLRLAPGSAMALIGPNGAGKSTLLQTLVGLLAPLDGAVCFDGEPVDERLASFRRDVAQVLDDDAFFPSLTGREHLLLTARGHGVVDAEETVARELATFGIEDRADALPSRLSSGQRRRLALAAAFVRPARLLVLDEPERRLDTEMRSALAERVATERDRGLTVLFASHDVAFVGTVADEAMLLTEEKCRLLPLRAVPGAMTGADG